jgi:C-terminal processing protease CtpA/Prc
MAAARNYNNYFTSSNLLKAAGVHVEKDIFTITLSDGSTRACTWFKPAESTVSPGEPRGNQARWDGDIFVVEFVECVDDDHLKAIARELKQAVRNGCTKVIIDARGNGGGSSNACERLLNAMDMKAPSYGMLLRYSEPAKEQKGYLRSDGTCVMKPGLKARRNPNVDLAVLCDRFTYSSATMLCVYVRDGGLGTLIGEASSNMPNHYGDITFVALVNSHLYGSVSHKRFLRPSGETESRMVVPDVVTASGDAYQAAMEYFAGK